MSVRNGLVATGTDVPLGELEEVRETEARAAQQRLEEMFTGKNTPLGAWSKRAACANSDIGPALFDTLDDEERAELTDREMARRQRTAAAVCRSCPVRAECLTDALENDSSGVWGGVLISTYGAQFDLIALMDAGKLHRKPAGRGRPKTLTAA